MSVQKEKRWNPEVGDTGNILPIVQSNGLLGLGTPLWLLLTTFPWRETSQPSTLTTDHCATRKGGSICP